MQEHAGTGIGTADTLDEHGGDGLCICRWHVLHLDQHTQTATPYRGSCPCPQASLVPDAGLDADTSFEQGGGHVLRAVLVPVHGGEIRQLPPSADGMESVRCPRRSPGPRGDADRSAGTPLADRSHPPVDVWSQEAVPALFVLGMEMDRIRSGRNGVGTLGGHVLGRGTEPGMLAGCPGSVHADLEQHGAHAR